MSWTRAAWLWLRTFWPWRVVRKPPAMMGVLRRALWKRLRHGAALKPTRRRR